jgi:hypothetical protein
MSDDIEFEMTYPCYFLCGERGGLVCITVDFVTCLCLFTDPKKLKTFQEEQVRSHPDDIAFPLEIAFAACHTRDELVDRLDAAETELASAGVHHVAINPRAWPARCIHYDSGVYRGASCGWINGFRAAMTMLRSADVVSRRSLRTISTRRITT